MEISKEEFALAIVFAIAGYIASMRETILFMNSLNPYQGLLVYYAIFYGCLLILSHFGLVIWKFHIDDPKSAFGALLITFAFFIIVNWASCYVNTVVSGDCKMVSTAYFNSEDGATYYFWSSIVNNVEIARWLTFVLTPFVLVLAGGLLLEEKPKLSDNYSYSYD